MAPCRDLRERAGASASKPGQSGSIAASRSATRRSGRARPSLRTAAASDRAPLEQSRRRLAEGAGVHRLRKRRDAASLVELTATDPASAGRRPRLGPAVLALERARRPERRRQPQDLGRVERRVHSLRQVVPPGPSSKTMPSAFNSSRMRSAAAKSRASFAAARSAIRASMPDASASPWNHSSDELSSRPSSAALRLDRRRIFQRHQPGQRQRRVEIVAPVRRARPRRHRPARHPRSPIQSIEVGLGSRDHVFGPRQRLAIMRRPGPSDFQEVTSNQTAQSIVRRQRMRWSDWRAARAAHIS